MRYFLLRHALGITEYAALVYLGWCMCADNGMNAACAAITAIVAGGFKDDLEKCR